MMSKGITYWPKVDHVYFWVRLLYHNRLSKVVFEEKKSFCDQYGHRPALES